jgi:hypothetical protein
LLEIPAKIIIGRSDTNNGVSDRYNKCPLRVTIQQLSAGSNPTSHATKFAPDFRDKKMSPDLVCGSNDSLLGLRNVWKPFSHAKKLCADTTKGVHIHEYLAKNRFVRKGGEWVSAKMGRGVHNLFQDPSATDEAGL